MSKQLTRLQTQKKQELSSFTFTDTNLQKIAEIIAHYPSNRKSSATMSLLDLAQRQIGWLPHTAIAYIASLLEIPPMQVYEVATFYTMYHLHPIGQYHIRVCTNLPCWLRGSEQIVQACRDVLGISPGESTMDNKFTIDEMECAGACVNAPVIQIGDEYFEDLDHSTMKIILAALQIGETVKAGSQVGRQCSCPVNGPTTLRSTLKGKSDA